MRRLVNIDAIEPALLIGRIRNHLAGSIPADGGQGLPNCVGEIGLVLDGVIETVLRRERELDAAA